MGGKKDAKDFGDAVSGFQPSTDPSSPAIPAELK